MAVQLMHSSVRTAQIFMGLRQFIRQVWVGLCEFGLELEVAISVSSAVLFVFTTRPSKFAPLRDVSNMITYFTVQNKLMLALYTVKSINTARVPRSSHRYRCKCNWNVTCVWILTLIDLSFSRRIIEYKNPFKICSGKNFLYFVVFCIGANSLPGVPASFQLSPFYCPATPRCSHLLRTLLYVPTRPVLWSSLQIGSSTCGRAVWEKGWR